MGAEFSLGVVRAHGKVAARDEWVEWLFMFYLCAAFAVRARPRKNNASRRPHVSATEISRAEYPEVMGRMRWKEPASAGSFFVTESLAPTVLDFEEF